MSKAFTKEDDGSGIAPAITPSSVPPTVFHLTRTGARKLSEKDDSNCREAMQRAEVLPALGSQPERAALGVTVHVRTAKDEERSYRLVSTEERALLEEGCSVKSPLGSALLGCQVGDVREVRTPRGAEEFEVVALEGESD